MENTAYRSRIIPLGFNALTENSMVNPMGTTVIFGIFLFVLLD